MADGQRVGGVDNKEGSARCAAEPRSPSKRARDEANGRARAGGPRRIGSDNLCVASASMGEQRSCAARWRWLMPRWARCSCLTPCATPSRDGSSGRRRDGEEGETHGVKIECSFHASSHSTSLDVTHE